VPPRRSGARRSGERFDRELLFLPPSGGEVSLQLGLRGVGQTGWGGYEAEIEAFSAFWAEGLLSFSLRV
jgi:hypothetical protein